MENGERRAELRNLRPWKEATISETSASLHLLRCTAPGRRKEDFPRSYALLKPPLPCPSHRSSGSIGLRWALSTVSTVPLPRAHRCLPASACAKIAFPKRCSPADTHREPLPRAQRLAGVNAIGFIFCLQAQWQTFGEKKHER